MTYVFKSANPHINIIQRNVLPVKPQFRGWTPSPFRVTACCLPV